MANERSVSEDTAAVSDVDDSSLVIIRIKAKQEIGDPLLRFDTAARNAIRAIKRVKGSYEFEPIVIASDIDASILEALTTSVSDYHVHCVVLNGQLIITNLSTGYPHAGGVRSILTQAANWNSRGRFAPYSDANTRFSRTAASAPDLTLSIDKKYALPGAGRRSAGDPPHFNASL